MKYVRAISLFWATILVIGLSGCSPAPNLAVVQVDVLELQEDADCILLRQGEHAALIDTGEAQDAAFILSFLQEQKVTELDYLILTHPDKDHIGGAPEILEHIEVGKVLEPYYPVDLGKERLTKLHQTLAQKQVPVVALARKQQMMLGTLALTVYPPAERRYSKENNYSLTVLAQHGEVSLLFAGDAEKKRLAELMQIKWPAIALYKVAHHGRLSANAVEFLELLAPTYAVVTAKQADAEIVAACERLNTELFYTGNGTVSFQSDGRELSIRDAV